MHPARKHGDREKVRELRKRQRLLPSLDPEDPGYRRLRYVRYADDHLLGFTGPKSEAEKIKARLARFLREDLKLELNQEKTLITHASTGAAKFLGYEITVQKSNTKVTRGRRSVNGSVRLRVPRAVIKENRPVLQARRTRATNPAGEQERPRHCCHLRVRVQGTRPVLPACQRRPPAQQAQRSHNGLAAEDAGVQAPLDRSARWRPGTRPRSRPRTA